MVKLIEQHGRKLMDLLIYLSLFGASYVLIKGIHDTYMEGKIDYDYSKHPLTVEDNPAVVVSIYTDDEIIFGVNYTIEFFDWDDGSEKYVTNPNDVLVYHDRKTTQESSNQPIENDKNLIEVTRVVTKQANQHALIISPLKTSLNYKLKNFQLRFTDTSSINFYS